MIEICKSDRDRRRVLRFLAKGSAGVGDAAVGDLVLLKGGERGTISVKRGVLAQAVRDRLVDVVGDRVILSQERQTTGRTSPEARIDVQAQHRDVEQIVVDMEAGPQVATVDWNESPLGQLMRRKTNDGAPFLSPDEYRAGERLRGDYTRGQIMPRLGANWVASVSSGRRDGTTADLTDGALAARQRVEQAIKAVGPELAGILIDICCFLKGMETVEAERRWPARSAKVVLKTALAVLSRHYDPPVGRQGNTSRHSLHWGADGYRPSIR